MVDVARTLLSWSYVVSETYPTRVGYMCQTRVMCIFKNLSTCRVHFNVAVSVQHSWWWWKGSWI